MQSLKFSDPKHVSQILNGTKKQTTRTHRYINEGDIISLIHDDSVIGLAKITRVSEFDPHLLSFSALDEWAIKDGFESFDEAYHWFSWLYGRDWTYKAWDVISFELIDMRQSK
jgi:hypothetical protein